MLSFTNIHDLPPEPCYLMYSDEVVPRGFFPIPGCHSDLLSFTQTVLLSSRDSILHLMTFFYLRYLPLVTLAICRQTSLGNFVKITGMRKLPYSSTFTPKASSTLTFA